MDSMIKLDIRVNPTKKESIGIICTLVREGWDIYCITPLSGDINLNHNRFTMIRYF